MPTKITRSIAVTGMVVAFSAMTWDPAAAETCSRPTRADLAPFVGGWSFATKHDGVVGAPPAAGIGTLDISECGSVTGLQVGVGGEPHVEFEASLSGRVLPFEEDIIRGPLTVTLTAVLEGPDGADVLEGTEATGDFICVGMLETNGLFLEARCIDTDEEVASGAADSSLLTEFVMKRTVSP